MYKYLNYAQRLYKYLPGILLLTAMNLFIAVKTGILTDTYLKLALFLATNALFLLVIKLIGHPNKDDYLWRDASRELPKDASCVKVVVRHKGTLYIEDAFYDRDLYRQLGGWGFSLSLQNSSNEVILWRYRTFEELREY